MKKLLFDTQGNLTARYDSQINTVIPVEAIEVTDEVFNQTMNTVSQRWIRNVQSGAITAISTAPTTERLVEVKWALIKRYHDTMRDGGFKVIVAGVDKWFHSDLASRQNYTELVALGTNIPVDLMWKTMDNTFVPMTEILAIELQEGAALHIQAVFAVAQTHYTTMSSSLNPTEYSFLANWPAIYVPA